MTKLKVGIINVTGYAGVELARLLYNHPEAEITSITGRSAAGQKLADVFPHLADIDLTITAELGDVFAKQKDPFVMLQLFPQRLPDSLTISHYSHLTSPRFVG